jgi:hypothetical protein
MAHPMMILESSFSVMAFVLFGLCRGFRFSRMRFFTAKDAKVSAKERKVKILWTLFGFDLSALCVNLCVLCV